MRIYEIVKNSITFIKESQEKQTAYKLRDCSIIYGLDVEILRFYSIIK